MSHPDGPRTGRPPAYASRGMVTTPHALASSAGLDALQRGGSAVDAAIAANAVLCVVYPHMAGLGGDGFWLIAGPSIDGVEALDASGPAAAGATIDLYRQHGPEIPARGPLAALTVPGAIDGWRMAHERHGKLPWAELFSAALHYARDGIPVSRSLADWLSEAGADDPETVRIWAMIETPAALLNLAAIAETGRTRGGRLDCFVVGLNDLRKETGIADVPGRPFLVPLLLQVVVAARASGLDVIDSVFNDFSDDENFGAECRQGRQMGFDGKMLIHPAQIAAANAAYGVTEAEAAEALAIVSAFAAPDNAGKAVVSLAGRMVEKLHADQAGRILAKADLINERKKKA